MNAGETAKPPALSEERNHFDLSRRPEQDVTAEIAAHVAAWKQARGRSEPAALPTSAANRSPMPVQPPRLQKLRESVDIKRPAEAVSSAAVNKPATLAPMLRAMPPAPSPRHSVSRAESTIQASEVEVPQIEVPKIEIAEWDVRAPSPCRAGPVGRSGWAHCCWCSASRRRRRSGSNGASTRRRFSTVRQTLTRFRAHLQRPIAMRGWPKSIA
ncbi:MAG: hypothetical protein ACREEP_18860 [Dongiaceae bacterium]